MSAAKESQSPGKPIQPDLAGLLARYLQRQADAHVSGVGSADLNEEVVPYEVGPVQPIDARPAWDAAVAVANYYGGAQAKARQAPPQWPNLVAAHEPATALAFCFGNFPQLVRNFQMLTQTKNLADLRPVATQPAHLPALNEWAKKVTDFPRALLALGTLRLARQFDEADELVRCREASVPATWQAAWANEKAALAWERGNYEGARSLWQSMPASVPVLFNRGMAALFCGHPAEAKEALNKVVDQLPETSAWHHLGRLYLTLVG